MDQNSTHISTQYSAPIILYGNIVHDNLKYILQLMVDKCNKGCPSSWVPMKLDPTKSHWFRFGIHIIGVFFKQPSTRFILVWFGFEYYVLCTCINNIKF